MLVYNSSMNWTFSIGWLIAGLVVVGAGAALTYFYKPVADNFAHGLSSYDRVKLVGIITIIIGLLVMTNLHTLLLNFFVSLVFKR